MSQSPNSQPVPGAPPTRRGYFAIGAERMSKAMNLGNLMRSAHGFGASFTFTVGATYQALEARADTSKGQWHIPHHNWATLDEMALPQGCMLVGVELLENAIDLPSFKHPLRAAYVLGPEQGSLSPALLDRWPCARLRLGRSRELLPKPVANRRVKEFEFSHQDRQCTTSATLC